MGDSGSCSLFLKVTLMFSGKPAHLGFLFQNSFQIYAGSFPGTTYQEERGHVRRLPEILGELVCNLEINSSEEQSKELGMFSMKKSSSTGKGIPAFEAGLEPMGGHWKGADFGNLSGSASW